MCNGQPLVLAEEEFYRWMTWQQLTALKEYIETWMKDNKNRINQTFFLSKQNAKRIEQQ